MVIGLKVPVHRWPYDYSLPGSDVDFIPQDVPLDKVKTGEDH